MPASNEYTIVLIILCIMAIFLTLLGLIPLIKLLRALSKKDWERVKKYSMRFARFPIFRTDVQVEELIVKQGFYKLAILFGVVTTIAGIAGLIVIILTF